MTSSAYSRSPPTGSPLASRVTRSLVAEPVGEVGGGRLAGHRRVGGENDLADAVGVDPVDELVDPQVGRVDAVDRAERAAEHVVEAVVLVCPLERDRRRRAARRRRWWSWSRRGSRQIAQVSSSVRFPQSRQKRTRSFTSVSAAASASASLGRPLEDVEREPLRGPLADPGQPASAGRRGSRPKG